MRGRVIAAVAVVGLLTGAGGALGRSTLRRVVPPGFVGVMADGPLLDSQVNLGTQFGLMAASGVQTVRVAFFWNLAQPYLSWSQVPAAQRANFVTSTGGVPTDFRATDRVAALAAAYGLTVLPVVVMAPIWDGSPLGNHAQPLLYGPYSAFLTALVRRYGPRGTFWSLHPSIRDRPLTMWQVWNEPDYPYFWSHPKNFAPGYVPLLQIGYHAIKRADPSATVVLGSLTGASWKDLASIYAIPGASQVFDEVAVNTYANTPDQVIGTLKAVRHVMNENGDAAKPLLDTEMGWPSALGQGTPMLGIETTEAGQASKLASLMLLLAADRQQLGLAGFDVYTWVTSDQFGSSSPFYFSGLLGYDAATNQIYPKPAYTAFTRIARRLEGRG